MNVLVAWRFRLLLVTLLALLLAQPFLGRDVVARLSYTTLWSIVLIATIFAISDMRWQRYVGLGLGLPILAGVWGRHFLSEPSSETFEILVFGLATLYFAVVAVLVMRHLITHDVTTDNVVGAVCAYLFLGLGIGLLFTIVETLRPGSFHASEELSAELAEPIGRRSALVYFSFVTLTTAGYGDIVPATGLTRIAAALEAVMGQFYLAILVAGLVGVRISRRPGG
jgi:voltage-gated potassium channel